MADMRRAQLDKGENPAAESQFILEGTLKSTWGKLPLPNTPTVVHTTSLSLTSASPPPQVSHTGGCFRGRGNDFGYGITVCLRAALVEDFSRELPATRSTGN